MNPLFQYLRKSPHRWDPSAFTPMCRAFLNATPEQKEEFRLKARDIPYREFLKSAYWGIVCGWRLYGPPSQGERPKCRRCNTPYNINIHHENYDIRGDEHRHMDKLDVLCRDCHEATHGLAPMEQLIAIEKRREFGTIGGRVYLTDRQRAEKIRLRGGA